MIGLILAAGDGTRLFGHSPEGGCKPLVEVNGKKLLSYSLDNLLALGIERAVIVVGRYKDWIENVYGADYHGIRLTYAVQEEPRGLVNAILSAKEYIDDDFLLQLSDELFFGFKRHTEYLNDRIDFSIGYVKEAEKGKIKANYSIERDKNGNVLKCTEKPSAVVNDMKGTGFCVFRKSAIDLLADAYDNAANKPNDLCDFINLLINRSFTGQTLEVAEKEINVNTLNDFRHAEELLMR